MFGMFPFMYNNNNYNRNNINSFFDLMNESFMNDMVDQLLSGDMMNGIDYDMFEEENYDISIKDYGNYYLIKGYLPGVTAKYVSIDFEKNKVILTIHRNRKQNYSNGSNLMITVMQKGRDIIKNFYIEEVDVGKLKASFNNNLLLLTIPKIKKITYGNDEPTIIDVENYKVE